MARWLDIALYKAMQRIIKAVELDDLTPVDDLVQHSSSAVDIRTVLMQIKTFWAQLSWPDVESSYAYISKILDVSQAAKSTSIYTVRRLYFATAVFALFICQIKFETQWQFWNLLVLRIPKHPQHVNIDWVLSEIFVIKDKLYDSKNFQ